MDEQKIPLPPWLPWATTACLAALVACLGELWILERARMRLMQEQVLLANAALKGAENQLEAERILDRREHAMERGEDMSFGVALLSPPAGSRPADPGLGSPWGVVVWESRGLRAILKVGGLPPAPAGRDYQLWLAASEDVPPLSCVACGALASEQASGVAVNLPAAVADGSRFFLALGQKGGDVALDPATSGGSIVLATLPFAGRISGR